VNNKSYINFNGSLKPAEQPVLPVDNRAFRYGDALFETIRYHKGTPLFFEDHYKRLLGGMDILVMETGSLPTPDKLSKQITSLVVKNAIFKDARIRLTVFRNGAGLYTPETNSVSYLIEASPLDNGFYTYNKKGLLIGVFDKYHKPVLPYSGF
jgi:branched-chain amino acid aminotransferase